MHQKQPPANTASCCPAGNGSCGGCCADDGAGEHAAAANNKLAIRARRIMLAYTPNARERLHQVWISGAAPAVQT